MPVYNFAQDIMQMQRDFAANREANQRLRLMPGLIEGQNLENSLSRAKLDEYRRSIADQNAIRQAGQQAESAGIQYDSQMAAMGPPATPQSDPFGKMQPAQPPLGGGPRPNSTIAIAKAYMKQGKVKEAKDAIELILKQANDFGDHEGAVNIINEVFGTKLHADLTKGEIINIADGTIVARLDSKKGTVTPLLENPKDRNSATNFEVELKKAFIAKHPEMDPIEAGFLYDHKKSEPKDKTSTPTPWMDQFKAEKGRFPTSDEITAHDMKLRTAGINLQLGSGNISPDAAAMAAEYYSQTGTLPSGMGAAGTQMKKQIMERAAQMKNAEGSAPNITQNKFGYQSGLTNQKMVRSLDAVDSGLNVVNEASKEFKRTDIGLLNRIILQGEIQVNDPKAIRFQSALQGVIDDLASALSGGGATTDQARNQARMIFNNSYSQGGLSAAIQSVRQVIQARRAAFSQGTPMGQSAPQSGSGTAPRIMSIQRVE